MGFPAPFRAWFSRRLPTQSRIEEEYWRVNRVVVFSRSSPRWFSIQDNSFSFVLMAELAAAAVAFRLPWQENFNSAAPWQTSFISQTIVAFDSLPAPAGRLRWQLCLQLCKSDWPRFASCAGVWNPSTTERAKYLIAPVEYFSRDMEHSSYQISSEEPFTSNPWLPKHANILRTKMPEMARNIIRCPEFSVREASCEFRFEPQQSTVRLFKMLLSSSSAFEIWNMFEHCHMVITSIDSGAICFSASSAWTSSLYFYRLSAFFPGSIPRTPTVLLNHIQTLLFHIQCQKGFLELAWN